MARGKKWSKSHMEGRNKHVLKAEGALLVWG